MWSKASGLLVPAAARPKKRQKPAQKETSLTKNGRQNSSNIYFYQRKFPKLFEAASPPTPFYALNIFSILLLIFMIFNNNFHNVHFFNFLIW